MAKQKTYGRKTAALLKFRKAETPRSAREFKRMYPAEFEALKAQTGGRDFSDEVLASLRQAYQGSVEWIVVEDEFEIDSAIDGLRRYLRYYPRAHDREWVQERLHVLETKVPLCDAPNRVLKLCVDYDDLEMTTRQAKIMDALSQSAEQSGHPSEGRPLYCVGWVRWCDRENSVWLIEEVQSDVAGARKGAVEPEMAAQARAAGLDPQEILDLLELVTPWHERFYEDAVGFLLERAAEAGVHVEMVDYSYKRGEESPMSIYTDLPKKMGMRLSPGSEVAKLDKTWKIVPNRRRASRRKSSKRRSSVGRFSK